jgi:ATP-binding cassette subfamily B protein
MIADISLIRFVPRLWRQLSARRRRQIVLFFGLMLVGACAEMISLGAVVPFIAALSAPEQVLRHEGMAWIAKTLGIASQEQLTLAITVAFAAAALLAAGVRLLLLWAGTRLAFATGEDFGIEVYRRTMYQPYQLHALGNSSDVITTITKRVGSTTMTLLSFLNLASSGVLLAGIILALLIVNPRVAIAAVGGFGLIYAAIMMIFRNRLRNNSRRIVQGNTQVIKTIQEGLGGIRDILLDGSQAVFCEAFRQADRPVRYAQGSNNFIGGAPRFMMEAFGMVLLAFLAYWLSGREQGLRTALPVLGALAIGAQRLLPILQQAYASWAIISGSQTSANDVLTMLERPLPPEALMPVPAPLRWDRDIRVESMRFKYNTSGPWVIDGLELTIIKGKRIGFIGGTGSGKSTLLDLLMGLLEPTTGRLLVDGQPLEGGRMRAWQRTIAHVPQHIYLADTSIGENIAFGVPVASIDWERVRRAAALAQIADYIESQPDGYRVRAGERGIVLSGGQSQRIGIARALYKQASVLVLDEATNALDHETERSVMQAIGGLGREMTVLAVTHRVTTFQGFDCIVELVNGRPVVYHSYEQMMEALRDRAYV